MANHRFTGPFGSWTPVADPTYVRTMTDDPYRSEALRLHALICEAQDSLEVIEEMLASACQHATDENQPVRSALFELRTILAVLQANGRPTDDR